MNRRSRQILALTAAALATWTFPFNQVAAIGWLTVAILILPTPRLKPEVVRANDCATSCDDSASDRRVRLLV